MINYPTTLDTTTTLPTESSGTVLATNHITSHTNLALGVIALETKVGIDSSAVNTSFDYKLSGVADGTKAVSLTGSETLTNKTLTSPTINSPTITSPTLTVTSDATGDIYYNGGSGVLTRLGVGSNTEILRLAGGVPTWDTETAVVDGSYSTKGVLQGLTDATTSGLTIASGVISVNSGTGNNQIVKLDGSSLLPAVDGSALTNVVAYTNGTATKDASDASTTQNIAHGLGKTPKKIKITAFIAGTASVITANKALVVYNGTTQSSMSMGGDTTTRFTTTTFILCQQAGETNNIQKGIITFDGTNIIITWTKTGSPTGTFTMLWEAEA